MTATGNARRTGGMAMGRETEGGCARAANPPTKAHGKRTFAKSDMAQTFATQSIGNLAAHS
eukprot:85914-Pyramimonas_sp.AAC.1